MYAITDYAPIIARTDRNCKTFLNKNLEKQDFFLDVIAEAPSVDDLNDGGKHIAAESVLPPCPRLKREWSSASVGSPREC